MTPNVIERLRATLTSERIACGHPAHSETTLPYERLTNDALAAIEQEMAELRKARDAWRTYALHVEDCVECADDSPEQCATGRPLLDATRGDPPQKAAVEHEMAAKDAEVAELRKRLDAVRVAFVALNQHCERLNIPITETAWIHGHRISAEDSDAGAAMLARLCDLLGITVEDATSNAEGGT